MAPKLRQRAITPEQALAVHDAAHRLQDGVLHGLALDFMPMVGAEHIAVDEMDESGRGGCWVESGLPMVVPVQEEVLCLVVPPVEGASSTVDMVCIGEAGNSTGTEDGFIRLSDRFDSDPRYQIYNGQVSGKYAPAYDLCLVRRSEHEVLDAGGLVPGVPLPIGDIREHGVIKFPAIAHRMDGTLVQIHKSKDGFGVFGLDGNVVDGDGPVDLSSVESLPQGIWIGCVGESGVSICDALVHGYRKVYPLPLKERVKVIEAFGSEPRHLADASALLGLPEGRWLVRWQEDVPDVPDAQGCFWFAYDAQTVRPGQYVETPTATETSAAIDAPETLEHHLCGGLRAQLHRQGDRVWVFASGCAFDRSEQLGQVVAEARALPCESVVLDGELVSEMSTSKLRSLLMGRKDLSSNEITFVPFDCIYRDGAALHNVPLSGRIENMQALGYGVIDGDGDILRRATDGCYVIDGTSSGWCVGEVQEAEDPEAEERRLSWAWVSDVHQGNEPLRFVYERRYDGVLSPDEATAALNFIIQGRKVDGISALSVSVEELRHQYREADWRDVQKVVSSGLSTANESTDIARVVASVAASGELHIAAPTQGESMLSLAQGVVGHAVQFLAAADHIEEFGIDAMLSGDAKWVGSQIDRASVEPGTYAGPGALRWQDGTAFMALESGNAVLGVQKPHFHEVFLAFDQTPSRSGRYTWTLVDLEGRSKWIAQRPDDQTPYLFKHDQAAEAAAALDSDGWVSWNPEGIRALAAGVMPGILPVNWESRLEPYDDSPFVSLQTGLKSNR